MVQVRSLIIVYASDLAALKTKRQKARDRYAKLTAEQKAQRNAKRREAYAMKKMQAVRQRCIRLFIMLVITGYQLI